jgi:hypothetical protein
MLDTELRQRLRALRITLERTHYSEVLFWFLLAAILAFSFSRVA